MPVLLKNMFNIDIYILTDLMIVAMHATYPPFVSSDSKDFPCSGRGYFSMIEICSAGAFSCFRSNP